MPAQEHRHHARHAGHERVGFAGSGSESGHGSQADHAMDVSSSGGGSGGGEAVPAHHHGQHHGRAKQQQPQSPRKKPHQTEEEMEAALAASKAREWLDSGFGGYKKVCVCVCVVWGGCGGRAGVQQAAGLA